MPEADVDSFVGSEADVKLVGLEVLGEDFVSFLF